MFLTRQLYIQISSSWMNLPWSVTKNLRNRHQSPIFPTYSSWINLLRSLTKILKKSHSPHPFLYWNDILASLFITLIIKTVTTGMRTSSFQISAYYSNTTVTQLAPWFNPSAVNVIFLTLRKSKAPLSAACTDQTGWSKGIILDLYLGGGQSEFWLRYQLSWGTLWIFSIPPGKCQNSNLIRSLLLSSKPFPTDL
jgi:hypothetical protein